MAFCFSIEERRFFVWAAVIILACGLIRILGWRVDKVTATQAVSAKAMSSFVPLDINRAGISELIELPGVGPVLAQRIVMFRQARGNFTVIEELDQVKGVGPKLLESLKGKVSVNHENQVSAGSGS